MGPGEDSHRHGTVRLDTVQEGPWDRVDEEK